MNCDPEDRKVIGQVTDRMFSEFWARPEFGTDGESSEEEAYGEVGSLALLKDGTWQAKFRMPKASSDDSGCVIAEDRDPYFALHLAAAAASRYSGIPLRENRTYPGIFEYLGWCSWDAMEIWVDEAGVLEKCDELREKKIPVRWMILDDMWADIEWTKVLPKFTPHEISFDVMHESKMRDFTADPVRFPEGLSHCINEMKEHAPKTDGRTVEVGIWHPVTGYWAGLTEDGPAAEKLSDCTVKHPNGRILPDFRDRESAYRFFDRLHTYFEACGATFVKIDDQSFLNRQYAELDDPFHAAQCMHDGMERSVFEHFNGNMINCMGMAKENLFSRRASCISRASDDFQPENRAWFSKHIKQCAFNSLFQGRFYVSDWDMWWTDDGQAVKNSLLRAVSGGPVYVSDRIGRSIPEVLTPLCLPDGRILRCEDACVPVRDCLLEDPVTSGRAFSVFNRACGAVYIASFDLDEQGRSVPGTIVPADYGMKGQVYVYEYFSGATKFMNASEPLEFILSDPDDLRLYALIPEAREGRTVLGMKGKMIGRKAVSIENGELRAKCPGEVILAEHGQVRSVYVTEVVHE